MALSIDIVEGPDAGRRVDLDGPIEVGRMDGLGLVLSDEVASRRHARFTPVEGGAIVEDLGSRNGTLVGGSPIHGPVRIAAGESVLIGVTVLRLRTREQVMERPSAVRAVPPGLAVPERQPDYLPPPLTPDAGTPSPSPRAGGRPEALVPELDPLLDRHVKPRAVVAAVAVFSLAILVLLVFLATR